MRSQRTLSFSSRPAAAPKASFVLGSAIFSAGMLILLTDVAGKIL